MLSLEDFVTQYVVDTIVGGASFPQVIKVTDADFQRLARMMPERLQIGSPPYIDLCSGGVTIIPTSVGSANRAALLDLSAGNVI